MLADIKPLNECKNSSDFNYIIRNVGDVDVAFVNQLSKRENETYKKLVNRKRKKEYLCGRILVKELLCQHFTFKYSDIAVYNSLDGIYKGKPILYINGDISEKTVSISHDSDWFATLISNNKAGIDIMMRRENISLFESEKNLAREFVTQENDVLCLLWTVKEAFTKALGVGFSFGFGSVKICDIDFEQSRIQLDISDSLENFIDKDTKIKFYYQQNADYICTVCNLYNSDVVRKL